VVEERRLRAFRYSGRALRCSNWVAKGRHVASGRKTSRASRIHRVVACSIVADLALLDLPEVANVMPAVLGSSKNMHRISLRENCLLTTSVNLEKLSITN